MKSKKIVLCGLFCALGVLLPQAFHMFGAAAGMTFLPMHIPVLMAGLTIGPVCGLITGVVSPVLSCLFTGMPVPAKLPFMVFELAAYGFFSGLFSKNGSAIGRVYLSLIGAQIAGRAVNALCALIAVYLLHVEKVSVLSVWTAVVAGLPGIVIQLVFIPPLVMAVKRAIKPAP